MTITIVPHESGKPQDDSAQLSNRRFKFILISGREWFITVRMLQLLKRFYESTSWYQFGASLPLLPLKDYQTAYALRRRELITSNLDGWRITMHGGAYWTAQGRDLLARAVRAVAASKGGAR